MEDNTLKEYLPAYGDRIPLWLSVRSLQQHLGRLVTLQSPVCWKTCKKGLTGKDMVKKCTSRRNLVGNKHAKKELKRVELGWMHFDAKLNSYKQVRGVSGGGTRHIKIDANLSIQDILEVGKDFLFWRAVQKRNCRKFFFLPVELQ